VCEHPNVKGVPKLYRSLIHGFPYNDLGALATLFDRFEEEVAAVVIEPVNTHMPEPGYLQGVVDLAHERGALVVFDEIVTGFRLANGGAQEYFGVTPDIACFGKAIANGMPLSAIVGKAEYMRILPATAYGMTYRGETLSLAAARATLHILREERVCEQISRVGSHVRRRFRDLSERLDVACELVGPDPRLTFAFRDAGGVPWEEQRMLFVQECLKHGVITNGNLLPSYALTDDAVERTLAAFGKALEAVARSVAASRAEQRRPNGRGSYGPRPLSARGFLEVDERGGDLCVTGWMLVNSEPPDSVEFLNSRGEAVVAEQRSRPDVAEAFPHVEGAELSGYAVKLPAPMPSAPGDWEYLLVARRRGEDVFRCPLVRHHDGGRRPGAGPHSIEHGFVYV
jgi:hypothetical protein